MDCGAIRAFGDPPQIAAQRTVYTSLLGVERSAAGNVLLPPAATLLHTESSLTKGAFLLPLQFPIHFHQIPARRDNFRDTLVWEDHVKRKYFVGGRMAIGEKIRNHSAWLIAMHVLWWVVFTMSIPVFLVSKVKGYPLLQNACADGGPCASFLQLTPLELADLERVGLSAGYYGGLITVLITITCLSFYAIGLLLYRFGRRDRYSVFASLLLLMTGTIFTTDESTLDPVLFTFFTILNYVGSTYLFFLLMLPDGKFVPRWTAIPAYVWLLHVLLGGALFSGTWLDVTTWNPLARTIYMLLMHALVVAVQIYRYRYVSTAEQRRQMRWLLFGVFWYCFAMLLYDFYDGGLFKLITMVTLYLGFLFWPFSIGMAVLENRLRHMSIAFNRAMVYMALSVILVLLFAVGVGAFGLLLQGQGNMLISLLTTGLVALLLQPLHKKVQRGVNQLVYGEQEEPYTVISRIIQQLEATISNKSVLPLVVEGVAQALKLPYAAILIEKEESSELIVAYGSKSDEKTEIPLRLQNELVGKLILGTSSPKEALPPAKRHLLDDLVRQVGIAVQAVRMSEELQRSRERLVSAREEERRRLRRDLHDGLGSSLASIMLKIDHVIHQCPDELAPTRAMLTDIQTDLRESIADIRRLVYALRPPALDEFGLLFALEELALQFQEGKLQVVFEAPERLPPVHAAVEVAVYRIIQEALTNTVRHAQATRCEVRLRIDRELQLEIRDNGCGLPSRMKPGIGIRSIKERAEELGGRFTIQTIAGEGTVLYVEMPLMEGEIANGTNGHGKNPHIAG